MIAETLREALLLFETATGCKPVQILTRDVVGLMRDLSSSLPAGLLVDDTRGLPFFEGVPVWCDPDLKFGEIRIVGMAKAQVPAIFVNFEVS